VRAGPEAMSGLVLGSVGYKGGELSKLVGGRPE